MARPWLLHGALAALLGLALALAVSAEGWEPRDPLEYPDMLSAPLGYNPRQSGSLRHGRIPRRYIVRMKRGGKQLEHDIANVLQKTKVSTTMPSAAPEGSVSTASLAEVGAKPRTTYSGGGLSGFVLDLPSELDESEAVQQLAAHEDVLKIVPDTWVGIAAALERIPPSTEMTTSLMRIGAMVSPRSNARMAKDARPLVQEASKGDIVVGLIDTGCDITNTNLNIVGGEDFTSDNSYGLDGNGHGTHVAGIMGARGSNHGIIGMYPNVSIFCLKVLGASGQGTMSTVVTALTWVADNGRANKIRVVNLSLSGEPNDEVCDAISAVTKQGITVVVAAGNNGRDVANFSPGNCGDALVVTAMSDFDGVSGGRRGVDATSGEVDDTPASFSNYAGRGARPANMIAAPGTRILSFLPAYKCLDSASGCLRGTPNLAYLSGTSMATPIVTAQVAMCYEQGHCKSNSTTEATRVMRATVNFNRANREYGFRGDALNSRSTASRYYGYLVYGNAF